MASGCHHLDSREDLEWLARDCGAEPQGNWQQKPEYEACKTHCPHCVIGISAVLLLTARGGECAYKCHTNTCAVAKNLQEPLRSLLGMRRHQSNPTERRNPKKRTSDAGNLVNVAPILPKLEPKKQSDAPVFPDEDGSLFPGCLEFLYNAYWGE